MLKEPKPPDGYYDEPRPEVTSRIPESAKYILDVGCASGALGRLIKAERPLVEVRGIEPVPDQAERARKVLDDVMVGQADDPLPNHWPRPDCIIFADVLEHLVDPWAVLERYRNILSPGGTIVASIPNVANRVVISGLLRLRWDYAPFGILDRTHLRFFTRETALELFEKAGFSIQHVSRTLEGFACKKLFRMLIGRENGRQRIYPRPFGWIIDAYTCQFIIVAT